ncbi:uncharacterized protein KZ484_000025 [Pholidichthys leucotaenia]
METEQPEMEARPRTPGNLNSVQGPETPLTGKTPKFDEQHVCENEMMTDQHLCNQENQSSLDQEEPEPLQIKEEEEEPEPLQIKEEEEAATEPLEIKAEQEEFWTSQEVEQFIQKQEADIFMLTSISVENEHREPEPNSDQLLCLTSAVTENQDEEGSWHVDSGSAESEELKRKQRCLKTRIHHEDAPHVQKKEEKVLQIQQLCNQERNSSLDQEEKDPAQEELYISLEQEHFGLKQETDNFTVTPTNEDSDNGGSGSNSDQLLSNSSADTDRKKEGADRNVNPESTKHEEPKPNKRNRSHSKNANNSPKSQNQCKFDKSGKSVKCDGNEKTFKIKSHRKKHHTVHTSEKPYASDKKYKDPSQLDQYKPYSCDQCGKRFSQRSCPVSLLLDNRLVLVRAGSY